MRKRRQTAQTAWTVPTVRTPRAGRLQRRARWLVAAVAVTALGGASARAGTITLVFRQGVEVTANGAGTGTTYLGVQDTELREANPTTNFGSAGSGPVVRGSSGGRRHGLLQFGDLFGAGASRVPLGATIVSATLSFTTSATQVGSSVAVHRVVGGEWSEDAVTWSNFRLGANNQNGVQADGIEAESSAVVSFSTNFVNPSLNVTSSLQGWSDGAANLGWAFINTSNSGATWGAFSSENTDPGIRPQLTVTFEALAVPEPAAHAGVALAATAAVSSAWRARRAYRARSPRAA